MTSRRELRQQIEQRAGSRCEYCLMHQLLQGATFHVEHIVPVSKGGSDELGNLALACPSCNFHKSDRVEARDPDTGVLVQLFNPRLQSRAEHFVWDEYAVNGLTPTGRATVSVLQLNDVRKLQIRQAEQRLGMFPPTSD